MQWSERYHDGYEPQEHEIKEFVKTPLWDDLTNHLRQTYRVEPKLFYSGCSMQKGYWKGWNVKFQKSGKSLCTLYPKQGYFVALVPVGAKEMAEADLLIPLCGEYMQNLYNGTVLGATGKSLAVEITNENILHDVKKLIALRVPSRTA